MSELRPTRASGRLRGEVQAVPRLTEAQRDQMWAVFSRYYAAVTREKFEADLADKQQVILLSDSGDGRIQGFSTLQVYARTLHGRRFLAVYSGDTVTDEAYWGQPALHRTFTRFLLKTKLTNLHLPVYWYLISKGYKTYLLLTRNFPTHYPRHDRPTPPFARAVLDLLSTDKFGEAYQPEQGILRFDTCQGRLKRGVAPIDAALLEYPDIGFFVAKNPGHADGDELCCLGRVDLAFPTFFLLRQIGKSLRGAKDRFRRLWAAADASS